MSPANRVVLAAVLSCVYVHASAGEFAYTCEVRHRYTVEEDGSLRTYPESEVEQSMKESPFSVSRETGVLTGNSASLDTSLAKSTHVIARGSKENAFQAVADFGDFSSGSHPFQYLRIEEFQKGALKPFVLFGVMGTISGICR